MPMRSGSKEGTPEHLPTLPQVASSDRAFEEKSADGIAFKERTGSKERKGSKEKCPKERKGSKENKPSIHGSQASPRPAVVGAPEATASFKQLRRVESRDELDFVKQKDITSRVLSELGIQQGAQNSKMHSARGTPRRRLSVKGSQGDGPALSFPITFGQAEQLRMHYCKYGADRPLDALLASTLIHQFTELYAHRHKSPVCEVDINTKLVVVGDTHGQLNDVLLIFQMHGPPSSTNIYLFNGDIADRGHEACEIYFLLFTYFLAEPSSVIINRGNHESECMNSMEHCCGGGFREEVLEKFEQSMYYLFMAMMKVLPLCTVISGKVFVVHGGLSSSENLTLDFIRSIPHMEFTMPDPSPATLQEEAWNDLLWSDPMDDEGRGENPRGCGILFGPNVTSEFLALNAGLELIVRSHQLPHHQVGWAKHHDGKCLTIFSASNYQGDNGNKGAILIFEQPSFPTYKIAEYYAPTLEMISQLIGKGKNWEDEGQQLMEREKEALEEMWRQKELSKIMVSIVENKPEIFSVWESTCGQNTVDFPTWSSILAKVLGDEWHWEMCWKTWRLGERDGLVDFVAFLKRFSVVVSRDEVTYFKFKAITTVYESILHSEADLAETFRIFDQDGDGMVDLKELKTALRPFDLGLTPQQLLAIFAGVFAGTNEKDGVPRLPVKQFLGRFTLVYKHARETLSAGEAKTDEQILMDEVMSRIAHLIASSSADTLRGHSGSKGEGKSQPGRSPRRQGSKAPNGSSSARRGSKGRRGSNACAAPSAASADLGSHVAAKLESLFERIDADNSGLVSPDEFVKGLLSLPGLRDIELRNGERLTEARLRQVARMLDQSGDGEISLLELLEAFIFEDSGDGDLADGLLEHILAVLFRHRQSIRAGARCFDTNGRGTMTKDEFQRVLLALNKAIAASPSASVRQGGSPFGRAKSKLNGPGNQPHVFMESQVCHLCDALSKADAAGEQPRIAYEEFFDAFEVVDSANPAVGVRLGKRVRKNTTCTVARS